MGCWKSKIRSEAFTEHQSLRSVDLVLVSDRTQFNSAAVPPLTVDFNRGPPRCLDVSFLWRAALLEVSSVLLTFLTAVSLSQERSQLDYPVVEINQCA